MIKRSKLYFLVIITILTLTLAACNTNASANKDFSKLQSESEHFAFHSFDKDKECIEDLANALEENYDTITNNLGVTLNNKVKVTIYPDIKAFHEKIGMPNAPDWSVAAAMKNEIHTVSPLEPGSYHNYNSIMGAAVHEFVRVVQFKINHYFYTNQWMSAGLAEYESKQAPDKTFIKNMIDEDKIPSLSDLNGKAFADVGGYHFSYTLVEYIIKEYGYETVIDIIKAQDNMETILGKSLDEFENDWINYLKENWGNQ